MGDFVFPPMVWPPRIVLDGHKLQFVPISNHNLLMIVAAKAWMHLIPQSLKREDLYYIYNRLADIKDPLEFQHLTTLNKQIVAGLCGTQYKAAQRIADYIVGRWFTFDGWCITNGFDPSTSPLHRVIAAGYQYWAATLDPSDKDATWKLHHRIWPENERDNPEAEEHAIMAQVLGGMKPNEGLLR